MIRKSFTLIELLVVIAIIAILAAILFPVFAQAKVAAKGAAAISDQKQTSLGVLMYAGDNDDYWVPSATWNTGSDPVCYGGLGCVSSWTWLINPYMKNEDIEIDPLGPAAQVVAGWPAAFIKAWNPTFGYNYNALAPWYSLTGGGAAAATSHVLSTTAVEFPANTVMLDSKYSTTEWAYSTAGLTLLYFTGGAANHDNGPALNTVMDPPDCGTINSYCIGNWGTGSGWSGVLSGNVVPGANTGGNSLRGTGAGEVAFCDGHVKKLAPGNLSAGTNWNPTLVFSSLVVNNASKYLWWAIPEQSN